MNYTEYKRKWTSTYSFISSNDEATEIYQTECRRSQMTNIQCVALYLPQFQNIQRMEDQ